MFFYHTIYMGFEKYMRLYEKHAFYYPLNSLMLLQPMHYNGFYRNVRLTHVLVNVCFTKRTFYVRYITSAIGMVYRFYGAYILTHINTSELNVESVKFDTRFMIVEYRNFRFSNRNKLWQKLITTPLYNSKFSITSCRHRASCRLRIVDCKQTKYKQ